MNKELSRTYKLVIYFVAILTLVAVVIVLTGIVRDAFGDDCTGFFGARMECKDSALLKLGFLFYNYTSMPIITFISLTGLFSQLRWQTVKK